MVKNVTYHNPIHQEENTPLVTIFELKLDTKKALAKDSRGASYIIDLAKSSFGGTHYPVPGSQWYVKKISSVWTLMARAPQQNPQLDPSFAPAPGDTYIGGEGITYVSGDMTISGGLIVGNDPDIGTIKIHTSNTPPTGWMICDGSAISRTTFSALFGIIGTTFGIGDGTTTFNIPNIKGKVPVGIDSGQTEFDTMGETGGEKTHALSSGEVGSHTHGAGTYAVSGESSHTHGAGSYSAAAGGTHQHEIGVDNSPSGGSGIFTINVPGSSAGDAGSIVGTFLDGSHSHSASGTSGAGSSHNHSLSGSSASGGSGTAHNNLQPYMALHFIIKAITSFVPPAPVSGISADGFHSIGISTSSEGHTAKVTGDAQKRFVIHDDGKTEWGSGSATQDTNLYRSSADTLKTDDNFQAASFAVGTNNIFGLIYPVGSVYISTVNTNPNTLFGIGTWSQIQDKFLLSAGSTYTAGATGGEATHVLSTSEMPAHSHTPSNGNQFVTNKYPVGGAGWTFAPVTGAGDMEANGGVTANTGGGAAHNNMPPYLVVYVWQRTA